MRQSNSRSPHRALLYAPPQQETAQRSHLSPLPPARGRQDIVPGETSPPSPWAPLAALRALRTPTQAPQAPEGSWGHRGGGEHGGARSRPQHGGWARTRCCQATSLWGPRAAARRGTVLLGGSGWGCPSTDLPGLRGTSPHSMPVSGGTGEEAVTCADTRQGLGREETSLPPPFCLPGDSSRVVVPCRSRFCGAGDWSGIFSVGAAPVLQAWGYPLSRTMYPIEISSEYRNKRWRVLANARTGPTQQQRTSSAFGSWQSDAVVSGPGDHSGTPPSRSGRDFKMLLIQLRPFVCFSKAAGCSWALFWSFPTDRSKRCSAVITRNQEL